MAIYSTLKNKVAASRLYSKKSFFNLDLNNNRGKGSSIYNSIFKLSTIKVCIFSALNAYIKVYYIKFSE